MLTLSTKDIRFLRILCYFTNVFLITPWYNFHNHTIFSKTIQTLWALFVLVIKVYGPSSMIWCEQNREIFNSFLFTQKIICVLTLSTSVIFGVVQVIATIYYNIDKWRLFLKNFEYVDRKFGNRNKTSKIYKNFYFWFLVKIVIFFCFFSPQFYLWLGATHLKVSEIFVGITVEIVNNFLFAVVLNALLMCFYGRYKDLRKKLQRSKMQSYQIEEIKQIMRILGESIAIFNEMFGYQILLLIFQTGLHIINYANFTFVNVIFKDADGSFSSALFNCGINIFLIVS